MNKQDAIALLEAAVAEQDYKNGEEIADKLKRTTTVYPDGWVPFRDGIKWLGFYFYESTDMFSFTPSLTTKVKAVKTHRTWWGGEREEHIRLNKHVLGPRDMLNLLKHWEPYDG